MGLFDAIASTASLGYQIARDNTLTGAEKEQNAFNAEQSAIARQFDSDEAAKARQFQEDMYNKYQSPQAMIDQYKAAGLNPALMYDDASGGSIPSASSGPTGPVASGSLLPRATDPFQALLLESQIRKNESEAKANNAAAGLSSAQTEGQEISNSRLNEQISKGLALTEAQTQEISQRIENLKSDKAKTEAETALLGYQALQASIGAANMQRVIEADLLLKKWSAESNRAAAALQYSKVNEVNKQIEKLEAETGLLIEQALTEASKRGLLDAEKMQALANIGLITSQTVLTQHQAAGVAQENIIRPEDFKLRKKSNGNVRWTRAVSTITGGLRDVGIWQSSILNSATNAVHEFKGFGGSEPPSFPLNGFDGTATNGFWFHP